MMEDGGGEFMVTTTLLGWLSFAVACSCSSLRYLVQHRKYDRLLLEEYIHIFALVQLLVYSIAYWLENAYLYVLVASGDETGYLDVRGQWGIVLRIFYWTTITTSKLVFLALYRRIFGVSRKFRIAWAVTLFITIAGGFLGMFQCYLVCGPAAFDCTSWNAVATCRTTDLVKSIDLIIGITLLCVVLPDMLLMTLPLAMLSRLHMPHAKKMRYAPIFLITLCTIALDITTWSFMFGPIEHIKWSRSYTSTLLGLEPSMTVIIAAMPTLLPWSGRKRSSGRALVEEEERPEMRRSPRHTPPDKSLLSEVRTEGSSEADTVMGSRSKDQ